MPKVLIQDEFVANLLTFLISIAKCFSKICMHGIVGQPNPWFGHNHVNLLKYL